MFTLFAKLTPDINKDKDKMRILGITLPENKRIEIGLTVLYGVGRSLAHTILDKAKVSHNLKPKEVSVDQENSIRKAIEALKIEGDLKREVAGNIKRLKDIGSYRGTRHMRNLPSRGQRTKTNARTKRGAKKTMGTGRKIADKK
jgi:small subunit ribosomal protein S13